MDIYYYYKYYLLELSTINSNININNIIIFRINSVLPSWRIFKFLDEGEIPVHKKILRPKYILVL